MLIDAKHDGKVLLNLNFISHRDGKCNFSM